MQHISKLPNVETTIFSVMSKLAKKHDAINLSQGFPDFGSDQKLIDLVCKAMNSGYNQYAPMAGNQELREAIAKKIDADLCALFTGFSTQKGGGAGVELTIQDLFEAGTELRTNNAPQAYYGVFHPKQIFNVKKALTNTFAGSANIPDLGNDALRNGFVGQIAGIQIFESSNVSVDGSDDSIGGVFSQDALAVAMMQDLKIESQRDASLRADEIVATAVYGVGELHDSYGVKLTADSLAN